MEKKAKRGRPIEIDDDTLVRLARDWQFILEQNWGKVGEGLHRSRTVKNIRETFSHISLNGNLRLDQFTYCDTRKTTTDDLRRMRKELAELRTLIYEASKAQRNARGLRDEAERNSVREIDEASKREFDIALSKFKETSDMADRKFAELNERLSELREALRQAEAYFAQSEILRFIKSHRRQYTPFNIASALAGIPILSARISSQRVWATKPKMTKGQANEIFDVIAQFFSAPAEDLIVATDRMREFLNRNRRNAEPHIQEMCRNWYFLSTSVRAAAQQPDVRRGYLQYRVFGEYMSRTTIRRHGDTVLAELNKLEIEE